LRFERSSVCFTFLGIALASSLQIAAAAQEAPTQNASTSNVISQLSTAFSGGRAFQRVQISGDAAWYAGSQEDSGTVTLTASSDGSSQMELNLAATGKKTETQSGVGSSSNCQWSGADGVAHRVDHGNCWRAIPWILPAIALHPSVLSSQYRFTDIGAGAVGSGTGVYRHVQGRLAQSGFSGMIDRENKARSTTDIGLDPVTHLPAVLAYSVHPDSGAPLQVTFEVRYSDYRAVEGAQIPFHIERYVNGSLQLDIHVTSAVIN
jgi:hypothetical protein